MNKSKDMYIYIYKINNQVAYIGRTTCLRRRKYEHKRYMIDLIRFLKEKLNIELEMNMYYFKVDNTEDWKEYEKQLIAKYQPAMNNQFKDYKAKKKLNKTYWRKA